MKFKFYVFNKTALYIAIEKGNVEVAKRILLIKELDVNLKSIILIISQF